MPCTLAGELLPPYLQLSALLIFVDQCLGQIIALSPYLQFACCLAEVSRTLLWSPILRIAWYFRRAPATFDGTSSQVYQLAMSLKIIVVYFSETMKGL